MRKPCDFFLVFCHVCLPSAGRGTKSGRCLTDPGQIHAQSTRKPCAIHARFSPRPGEYSPGPGPGVLSDFHANSGIPDSSNTWVSADWCMLSVRPPPRRPRRQPRVNMSGTLDVEKSMDNTPRHHHIHRKIKDVNADSNVCAARSTQSTSFAAFVFPKSLKICRLGSSPV